MASTYTDLLRLELMANKENKGTWGTKTNNNLDIGIEAAIAGMSTVSMTDANYTLTTAYASDDESRKAILKITSSVSLTATRNVIIPTSSKIYIISNKTSGGKSIIVKTLSGTGVTISNDYTKIVYCDGTNVVEAITQISANTITAGTNANTAKWPNSSVLISSTATANQKSELHNIGLLAEGVAHTTDSAVYGIGVYGVGYTSPTTRCSGVVGEAHVLGTADVGSAIGVRGYSNDTHTGGHNVGLYGDASGASGSGSNYSLYLNNGGIYSATAQTWTLTANLTFSGSNIIHNSSNVYTTGVSSVLIGGSGTLGYNTGAGGTVVQPTNKTTTVTLNKGSGEITTNNAVLAGNTTVSFLLNNSTITPGDVLVLNHYSGGTAGSYALNAQSAAGSASINVRNITNASLQEAITIAFAVIKTATA
jgi:hypothetical protein